MSVKATVALVGRPNVGKSALFNRIVGQRISIVDDTPGVTRDRIDGKGEWSGHSFNLIDTGGIFDEEDDILKQVVIQAEVAIDEADVIVFVTDGRDGITPADEEVAATLRKTKKPVLVAVNKSEGNYDQYAMEFYQLGFEQVISISALHGTNTGQLLDEIVELLPEQEYEELNYHEDDIMLSVIGRPNVGKSSLINKILNKERLIVSNMPGTTRDAIDTVIEREDQKYVFIDTAGLRKKSKIDERLEKYSVIRSIKGMERSNIALLLIDVTKGILEQDKKIAGLAEEKGKGLIILLNKWDAIEKDGKAGDKYYETVRLELPSVNYAPIMFLSAQTGKNVEKIFPVIDKVSKEHSKRITTADVNRVIEDAVNYTPPPSKKGKRLKIYYATQVRTRPPTFVLFVNNPELMKNSYKRYLQNQLRRAFGFEGTPIRILERVKQRR
ncbi:ribosome biogenesis GTPase Der [Natranaerobius thermophilus]|uniref:GTPase Der n=1 Tax=Natranaerobius thermophilus (strain ATCC BAA-1301 / DSM 18059 / JW/NM-WN-LF) TaxID=457570 RepID=DER_NATTJ|nr:ribosome biogenesis GTPase Der [Natranaerobius thermophilus]B2A4M9.1 RecName: Full=GTPase Der; AltName: Full=GTP-binding protein EngA [Natranaerobius thermophilus JW/NM-WN-LF]ACB85204.1 small GTP-binding protein [Natranaerobius thermophilus JW/NM-WN-LF]